MKALRNYHARLRRALDHVDRHLDDDLDLAAVSEVAAFSKYHFHRQFTAVFGVSVHRYVQLARLKRASYQLAFRDGQSVTGIAFDAGYDAPDAFARAFRQRFGQSPSSFRTAPDWGPWLHALGALDDARSTLMTKNYSAADVTIREVSPTSVAILEHRGDPAMVGATIQRFIAWRRKAGLVPPASATFNIFHGDPRTAAPADYRMDLCAGTDQSFEQHGERVEAGLIPGGRCAVLPVVGGTDDLEPAALFLYRDWLPASGEELRDFPLYCQRLSFFPDVSEHQAVAELFLPLR
ncbi:AraC family transcriptional regulator [Sphingomonas aracearum]|uniref:Helix-turn-helix domain-containing protein n=1 Tax=Sphingomonas aracearum TaxID=2283317 RepID=A0A369VZD9_9SPHN|nr:AraC family transcriptional regulator [Sphingomonas aracearum]RDE06480.1 helix-turn-helix domain-containing protein [Sphingomonas aracearum]